MTAYTYNPGKAATAANYPLIGNPHKHFYPTRNLPVLMAVQHITAGLSDFAGADGSAESTLRYSSSTATQASYHGIVDSDSIIDCLPDTYTAWAQGVRGHNFNSPALSLEIGLLSPDWRKPPAAWVDKTIRNAARWWAPRVKKYGIPLRLMTDRNEIDRLIAARKMVGFVEHHTLDPVNRTDAGFVGGRTTFPWALLFKYIREELAGTTIEEDEVDPKEVAREILGYKNPAVNGTRDVYQLITDGSLKRDQIVAPGKPASGNTHWTSESYMYETFMQGLRALQLLQSIAGKVGVDVDEAVIAQQVAKALGPELKALVTDAVAAGGSPEQIAQSVVEKLGAALTKES